MSNSSDSVLPAIGYLSGLSQMHRDFLSGYGRFIRTSDKFHLIRKGDTQDSLYLIIKGTLHVTSTAEGRTVLLASLNEGETLGEVNIFDPTQASANVVSIGESLIWKLSREKLDSISKNDPVVANMLLKGLLNQFAVKVRNMNEKLLSYEEKGYFGY